jgi:hypothetical protein
VVASRTRQISMLVWGAILAALVAAGAGVLCQL